MCERSLLVLVADVLEDIRVGLKQVREFDRERLVVYFGSSNVNSTSR